MKNNCTEKFNRGDQEQTISSRKKESENVKAGQWNSSNQKSKNNK